MLKEMVFSEYAGSDLTYSFIRVFFGCLLVYHGWSNLSAGAKDFPDPLGIGSQFSLALTVFSQLVCGVFVAAGLFTRVSLIPAFITFFIIFFIFHAKDSFHDKEQALLYLVLSGYLFYNGPGVISVDTRFFS